MKRVLVKLYDWSLHLYPAPFRQMFGDEMKSTFALRLDDAQSRSSLIHCVVIEMILLPVSVIREHQQQQIALAYAGGFPMLMKTTRAYRWSLIASAGLIGAIVMLVIVPFIGNGIHLQSDAIIINGAFDPKGFAPFVSDSGQILYDLMTLITLVTPVWCVVSGVLICTSLIRNWHELKSRQRVMGFTALLMISSLLIYLLSPMGRVMFIWFLD